jgi:N-acetylneuraminic acid mutarotase
MINLKSLVMRKHRQNPGTGILIILMFNMGMITSIQAQNGWERMPDMPTSRAVFKSVLHDGKIYAIGGLESAHPPYGITTEVYDTETGEWFSMASMENPCSGLSVEIINNKIYVIGGVYSTKQQYTVIQEYDIETDTWSTKCTMPEPRFNHISEVIDGKIYIAAGMTVDENGSHPGLTSALVYDPVNDQWDTIADLHHERYFGRSCVFNNKIYVFGGAPPGVPYNVAHQSIEIYDPETDVWTISEDEIPIPFMGGMVQVYGDSILLLGGFRIVLDKENYSCIYKYVPDAPEDKWEEMVSMPVKRGVMAGNIVNHYLHMIGGYDGFQNDELEISQDNHWRLDLDSFTITGLQESIIQEIRAYPNPTSGILTVETDYLGSYLIINSANGQSLHREVLEETPHQVNLSSFQKGIYFITIKSKDFISTKKIIKL